MVKLENSVENTDFDGKIEPTYQLSMPQRITCMDAGLIDINQINNEESASTNIAIVDDEKEIKKQEILLKKSKKIKQVQFQTNNEKKNIPVKKNAKSNGQGFGKKFDNNKVEKKEKHKKNLNFKKEKQKRPNKNRAKKGR